jgi:hypothetical protein
MPRRKSTGLGMADTVMPARSTKRQMDHEKRYMAEDDLRTLERADEIRRDRGRMSMCKKVAREKISSLKKIGGR